MNRPCLNCGTLTNKTRCPTCTTKHNNNRYRNRPPRPHHTNPTYRAHSRHLRQQWNADPTTLCWICQQPAKPNDPWTADHYHPGQHDTPLLPAHRSCNSRRGANQRWGKG